jgi:hypothetical protein
MNKLFQQLLRQAKARALPELERGAKGFIEDLAAPVVRSVGSIPDQLARPTKKWVQQVISPATFNRYGNADTLMRQQVGRTTPSVWSLDARLAQRLDPAQRFLQEYGTGNIPEAAAFIRQAQGGIKEGIQTGMDTSRGILRKLQGIGPTALNPLAARTPTTLLGKTGQFFNPLSRANAGGIAAGLAVDNLLPESMRDTANVGLFTPGPLPVKVLSAGLYDTFLNPRNAGVGLGNGTLEANAPEVYVRQQALRNSQGQSQQRPVGSLSILNGNEVAWRGPDLGWQRTYSEGANPPPSAPGSLQSLSSGRQAGQVGSNVISNGAGVPAQRSDVINRALSQEILNAAQQFNAPTNIPLPAYYEGQQQLGRSMMQDGTLVSQLQELGGAPGMTPENLKTWAEKNPALAYRELLKRRGVQ